MPAMRYGRQYCGNCEFEDKPVTHPNCYACVHGAKSGDGWQLRKKPKEDKCKPQRP